MDLKSLLVLREAAMKCSNLDYRYLIFEVADDIEQAIKSLGVKCDAASLRHLNCCWALAQRVYDEIPPEGDPAPVSGPTEPARLAA